MGTRRRMYTPGPPFESLPELLEWLQQGRWVYWAPGLDARARPKHPAVIECRQLWTLRVGVQQRCFLRALKAGEQ